MYFHCIFHNSFVQNEHSNFDRSLVSILLDHHITVYRKRKKFLALVSGSYLLTGKSIMRSPVNSFHEYFIGFFRYFSERHSGLLAGTRTSWDMNGTLSLLTFIEMTWCGPPLFALWGWIELLRIAYHDLSNETNFLRKLRILKVS